MAIETPEEIREQTNDLNVGFRRQSRTWELIVKYHGDLSMLAGDGIPVEPLIAGYAIVTVPENLVETIAGLEQIEYVEKPKSFFYERMPDPGRDSCAEQLSRRDLFLSGQGVLVAIIDSGIAYQLPAFRTPEGKTRIRALWDQSLIALPGERPPEDFADGVEYGAWEIDEALESERSGKSGLRTADISGHGTAVAGIAVGSSRTYAGMAPKAGILAVKLGQTGERSAPRTTQIMRAVTWCLRKAEKLGMPLVINLSFGNNYGAHDGSSLLERFLDNAAETGRTVICVGSGNEGNAGGHFKGQFRPGQTETAELLIGEYERTVSVQLWSHYSDSFRVKLRSPGGMEVQLSPAVSEGKYSFRLEQTEGLVYTGEPTPYSAARELYLELYPAVGNYINSGSWSILLEPVEIRAGGYHLYLPAAAARSLRTAFSKPSAERTLTIPSTAAKVITVGAYDSTYEAYADFSGRGSLQESADFGSSKPTLTAPGVNVPVILPEGGDSTVSGTSFATPAVSGAAALLMEWGIVRGNDPFLYGEKMKAYLQRGAKPLRGEASYPNAKVGYGSLCVADSIPD